MTHQEILNEITRLHSESAKQRAEIEDLVAARRKKLMVECEANGHLFGRSLWNIAADQACVICGKAKP